MDQKQFEDNARQLRLKRAFFRSFMHGLFIAQAFAWKDAVVLATEAILPAGTGGKVGQGLLVAATTTVLSMMVAALALRLAQWSDYLPWLEFGREPPPLPPLPPSPPPLPPPGPAVVRQNGTRESLRI